MSEDFKDNHFPLQMNKLRHGEIKCFNVRVWWRIHTLRLRQRHITGE